MSNQTSVADAAVWCPLLTGHFSWADTRTGFHSPGMQLQQLLSGALYSSLKGCIQGLFSPVLWELIEANLHLSLQSLLLHSLALLVWAERRDLHFFNHYFLILFSRKNSSVLLHSLGFLLAAAVISTPAPKLKSHGSCQTHGTGWFSVMQVKIINIFFYSKPFITFQGSALANAVSEACKKNCIINLQSQSHAKWQPSAP